MFNSLNCVIVDADDNNRQEMQGFLTQHGVTTMAAVGSFESLSSLLSRADRPQVVLVNLDPGAMDSLRTLAPYIKQFPDISFFAMSQVLDPNLLMEAMHQGIKEFIALPIVEHKFKNALERVNNAAVGGKTARILNVIPTMGGVGSTTIACNLAASLAQTHKTALMDMDLCRGQVASYFDVHPRYTLADLMSNGDTIDRSVIENALTVHKASKCNLLARPELPEDSLRVSQPGLARLLGALGRSFEYVVVDSTMSVDPVYSTIVNAADMNLIVMQLNVPSAKNAERFVGALRRSGVESARIRVVVNRFVKKGWDIEPSEVERALGLKISWMVPNDYKNAIASVNYGEPIVLRTPKCEMSQSIMELAQTITRSDEQARRAA